jgi:hypothetical protein
MSALPQRAVLRLGVVFFRSHHRVRLRPKEKEFG